MTSLQFAQFRLGSAMHNLTIPDNLIVSRVFHAAAVLEDCSGM